MNQLDSVLAVGLPNLFREFGVGRVCLGWFLCGKAYKGEARILKGMLAISPDEVDRIKRLEQLNSAIKHWENAEDSLSAIHDFMSDSTLRKVGNVLHGILGHLDEIDDPEDPTDPRQHHVLVEQVAIVYAVHSNAMMEAELELEVLLKHSRSTMPLSTPIPPALSNSEKKLAKRERIARLAPQSLPETKILKYLRRAEATSEKSGLRGEIIKDDVGLDKNAWNDASLNLKTKGLLESTGYGNGAKWFLTKDGLDTLDPNIL